MKHRWIEVSDRMQRHYAYRLTEPVGRLTGHLWTYLDPLARQVVYDATPTRAGHEPTTFLAAFRGTLQADAYAGYDALYRTGRVRELGCWAHARRKFVDLHAASGSPIAAEAIQRIAVLYGIEAQSRDLDPEARYRYRQQHAKPVLDAVKHWLDTIRPQVLRAAGAASAIDYSLKRWAALTRYLDDGRYPIDNNPIENAIRPIALGRKNWLFAGSLRGGQRAAAAMSLIEPARMNGHDPYAYLRDVLERRKPPANPS